MGTSPRAAAIRRHHHSAEYQRARKLCFMMFGNTCHLCGHGGAGVTDHLRPVALYPFQPITPWGMRPSHGRGYPCNQCPQHNGKPRMCNELKGIRAGNAVLKSSQEW
jgi:hypothetical protein